MMHKLKPSRQGVREYVRLSNLPGKLLNTFLEWLPQTYLTKVNEGDGLLNDCIEYDDYEFWYEHCYEKDLQYFEEQI